MLRNKRESDCFVWSVHFILLTQTPNLLAGVAIYFLNMKEDLFSKMLILYKDIKSIMRKSIVVWYYFLLLQHRKKKNLFTQPDMCICFHDSLFYLLLIVSREKISWRLPSKTHSIKFCGWGCLLLGFRLKMGGEWRRYCLPCHFIHHHISFCLWEVSIAVIHCGIRSNLIWNRFSDCFATSSNADPKNSYTAKL